MSQYEAFMANFTRLMVSAKISGKWVMELKAMRSKNVIKAPGMWDFTAFLRAMLPKFKWKDWAEEMVAATRIRRQRAQIKAEMAQPRDTISEIDLDAFALAYWEKKGKPRFKKRLISGVAWGNGLVRANDGVGWSKVIYERVLGVRKLTEANGHVRLAIICPD